MFVKLAICALLISGVFSQTTSKSSETTEPKTPTKVSTTEPPKTTVTTQPPTTHKNETTAPPSPTTPSPMPPAPSHLGDHPTINLNITSNGTTCAKIVGQMLLSITYNTTNGKTNTSKIGIPVDSYVFNSNCTGTQTMNVQLKKNTTDYPIVMSIVFGSDSNHIFWKSVSFNVSWKEDFFPNVVKGVSFSVFKSDPKSEYFKANSKGSYLCNSDINTEMGGVGLETWNFQYTAYQSDAKTFSKDSVSQCSQDEKTNSIVPIAVGAALAGLVVIVLIAYLIGRRRNRKGYESV